MTVYKKLKYYYGKELAELLGKKIKKYYTTFNVERFISDVAQKVDDLELKARVEVITDALFNLLPKDYSKALAILTKITGPELTTETGMFKVGYWLSPIAYFIEKYGLDELQISTGAIHELTKRHTGEFAVRPFLVKYPEEMLNIMIKWSTDDNVHVRRLSSEGVRPRLPWAKKLQQYIDDPQPILPILENLKDDSSKFVQRSVANCINDILKDNYDVAINVLTRWSNTSSNNTKWIIKHALRNELKKKNQVAIDLISK